MIRNLGLYVLIMLGFGGCSHLHLPKTATEPPPHPQSSYPDWRTSSRLDAEQKKLVEKLSAETLERGQPFRVAIWDKAGSILDISLDAGSQLNAGPPAAHAASFLATYGALWHISKADIGTRLTVVNEQSGDGCSSVTLQLREGGLRVFNASLHFSLTAKGRIRRVTGFMDATPATPEIGKAKLGSKEAVQSLFKQMSWPQEAIGSYKNPDRILFDPYFVSGERHVATESFLFNSDPGSPGGFVVNGQTGRLEIQGPPLRDANLLDTGGTCDSESSSVWSANVVVDPLTNTPAWVSFRHFGGVKADGSSAADRVLNTLALMPLQRMFGDARPREHLRKTGEWTAGSTTTVRFEQYYAGFRVEGSYLRAVVSGNRVQELFARLPYFPDFDAAVIDQGTARDHARTWHAEVRCGTDTACLGALVNDPISEETVVFSAALFDEPGVTGSHLAYKFRFETVDVWWDAATDRPLRSEGRGFGATPFQVWSSTGVPRTLCADVHSDCRKIVPIDLLRPPEYKLDVALDGTELPPLHMDSLPVKSWMGVLDARLNSVFAWDSVLGDGRVSRFNPDAHVDVIVGSNLENGTQAASFPIQPRNDPSQENLGIELGLQVTAPDVLGHEFGHHITNAMYGPFHRVEQGALAEHFSDIIGMTAFPDNAWNLAAASRGGPVRNMLNPTSPGTPAGATAVDHVSQKSRCDALLADCTYVWLGIPNRAFALIASGVPSPVAGTHPLGLETAAKLYFETVRDQTSPFQMESVDRFLNQRIKVMAACNKALESGPVRSRVGSIGANDCENVGRAFDSVGVVAAVSSGFDRFANNATSGSWTQTIHQGARFFQGCGLSGHVLNVEIREGLFAAQLSRSDTDTPPLAIVVQGGGEVIAQVVARCGGTSAASCPDPMNREVTYAVDSKWVGQPTYVWIDERLNVPSGQSPDSCLVPNPGDESVLFWSTPIVHTGSAAMFGKREDRAIAPNTLTGSFVPGPCQLLEIGGIDSHRQGSLPPAEAVAKTWSHGVHGFTVTRTGTSPFDYAANLHTWTDGFSGLFARVVYRLAQPPGASCAFQGLSPVQP